MKVAQLAFSLSNRAGWVFEIQVGLSLALQKGMEMVASGEWRVGILIGLAMSYLLLGM